MTARIIFQVFDQYQKAKTQFIQAIIDVASRQYSIQYLEDCKVLDLLSPLLWDVIPSIQQLSVIAVGRLANHNIKIAQNILEKNIVPLLLKKIHKQNDLFKTAVLFLLRAIAKYSPEMAFTIVSEGGLEAAVMCLEDFNPGVMEAAAWAIGYISRHNQCLAQVAIDSGAVALLIICLQESEMNLKQICVSTLCDICKHNSDQAQFVVDAGAIAVLSKLITYEDPKLKRQILSTLSCIAKHSSDLAEIVLEAQVFLDVLLCVRHTDDYVSTAAVTLIKEICKHSLQVAHFICNSGGIEPLVETVSKKKSSNILPAIIALGYIAGHSDELAWSVIQFKGVDELVIIIKMEQDSHILSACVWALGQIGKHSSDHAKKIAECNILASLISMYTDPQSEDDLKTKCKASLKQVLLKCTCIEDLESLLLQDAPVTILKYILRQFSQILAFDAKARRLFITTGGLKKIQEIQAEPGSALSENILMINLCFPEEIIRYFSPGYSESLLETVEQYVPNCSLKAKESVVD